MVSSKSIYFALAGILALLAPQAQAYDPHRNSPDFNIDLQRYSDGECREPYGRWRRGKTDQRVRIKGPKPNVGERCESFKKGDDAFGSFDFKWKPRKHYEADTAQDDPWKGKGEKKRYCYIEVYEERECQGEVVGTLSEANRWEQIEECAGGFDGKGRSVLLVCSDH